MATVGKNILDNLTTGMYADSKIIYREYIQNACDQIDKAVNNDILNKDEGQIDIFIDSRKRYISIKDNATGASAGSFVEDLGDIANSSKQLGKDKGFRGIGRLCGLAYCKTLKFTTSARGEDITSVMICDAQKMREMLIESKKYTLDEIWEAIVKFESYPADCDEHFFEVELIDINRENTDLLNKDKVIAYLSFVAPVPYKNTFILRNRIYKHAQELGYTIDEYSISVNGSSIFKNYTTKMKIKSGEKLKNYDEITDLEFKDFFDDGGNLIAWMWFGISRFEKQIPPVNEMRGLRVRSDNIQIGDDAALTALFKESRGNYYFVGEVFAVSSKLIPNSQRNYFNENETRVAFENELRCYFFDVLHKLYYDANQIKNAYKRQEEYIAKVEEYNEKEVSNGFVDETARQKMQYEIEEAKEKAEKARKKLEKVNNGDSNSLLTSVSRNIGDKYKADKLTKKAEKIAVSLSKQRKKQSYIADGLSKLSRNERKIVGRILSIITDTAPRELAEEIIKKIREELK